MSRMENREVMGFFAIEPKHHAAILRWLRLRRQLTNCSTPLLGKGYFLRRLPAPGM
jgi:hypothetical protein